MYKDALNNVLTTEFKIGDKVICEDFYGELHRGTITNIKVQESRLGKPGVLKVYIDNINDIRFDIINVSMDI